MLFDSHAHYDDPRFDQDRETLLASMQANGVSRILCAATDVNSADVCIGYAEKYPFIWASAGIHPHEAKSFDPADLPRLQQQLAHPRCVAVGECGLDYALNRSPKETQLAAFRVQLALAKTLDLPVIVHDREAHQDTLNLLREAGCRGVIHCYSGSAEMAKELVDLGYYISFTGVITFKNARKSLEVVKSVPRERLMIETDAPYLTPEPHRGKRNDSTYVRHTCQAMADVLGLSFEETAALTYENACRCFGIEP